MGSRGIRSEDDEMSYPALRITTGPDEGKRIPLITGIPIIYSSLGRGPVEVGSQVRGPGQLSAPGVAPHHADFHLIPIDEDEGTYQVGVTPVDGEVAVNGAPTSRHGDEVKLGDEVLVADCRIVLEEVDGLPPASEAFLEALDQAAAGSAPFRFIVQFKPDAGEKTVGLLAARQGRLALADAEGQAEFDVPLAELQDVSFPKLQSSMIKLLARGTSYKIWLVEEIWIPNRGDPSYAGGIADVETELASAYGIGGLTVDVLNQLNARTDRGRWKKILTGETQAEEISQEVATDALAILRVDP